MNIVSKLAAMAIAASLPNSLLAQDIKLVSKDGLLTLEGTLLGFDGALIEVKTSYGDVKIPADEVLCIGICPEGVALAEPESTGPTETNVTVAYDSDHNLELLKRLFTENVVASSANATISVEDEAALISALGADETALLDFASSDETGDIKITSANRARPSSAAKSIPLEVTSLEGAGAYELAVEPMAVVLGPDTGLESITHEELARIYAGTYTNWKELGGNDTVIQPIASVGEQQSFDALNASILAPFGLTASEATLRVRGDAQAVQVVSVARGGLSVVALDAIEPENAIPLRDACGNLVAPSAFAISTGEYPLTVSTFAKVDQEYNSSILPRFFDALATDDVQKLLGDSGYASQSIVLGSEVNKGTRVAEVLSRDWPAPLNEAARELMLLLLDAKQLSVRFQNGAADGATGARVRSDFVRLAEAIERGDYDGQDILFVGFSPDGAPDVSIPASQETARSVMNAFQVFAPDAVGRPNVRFASSGHGNVGIACSAQDARETAQIVEVWVRPSS